MGILPALEVILVSLFLLILVIIFLIHKILYFLCNMQLFDYNQYLISVEYKVKKL